MNPHPESGEEALKVKAVVVQKTNGSSHPLRIAATTSKARRRIASPHVNVSPSEGRQ